MKQFHQYVFPQGGSYPLLEDIVTMPRRTGRAVDSERAVVDSDHADQDVRDDRGILSDETGRGVGLVITWFSAREVADLGCRTAKLTATSARLPAAPRATHRPQRGNH